MDYVSLGKLTVSRFILGSNPFCGFSHQSPAINQAMRRFFTVEQIKQTLRAAEALGVNTLIARTDALIIRVLAEYWDEGGTIQWIAQTCPEYRTHEASISHAAEGGASACFIHGGIMDNLLANDQLDEVAPAIEMIRQYGMPAGVAGHNPAVFTWAEAQLEVDFYMCAYYNSAHRDQQAEHVSGMSEWFLEEDRRIMTTLIQSLSRPVIHYKVLAAGRNEPAAALRFAAQQMRAGDMACVGIYQQNAPEMLKTDIALLHTALAVR